MSKQAVKEVLEYAIAKGYEHTGMLRDSEIDAILTKGTTTEQWDRYYIDQKEHEAHCERFKPQKEDMEFVDSTTGAFRQDKFDSAMSEWHRKLHMDAPNKPGYYRANND